VSAAFAILLATAASVVTWIYTSARWRSRIVELETGWRRMQKKLLAEMSNLQHDVERARIRATQLAQDSTTWAGGYKQGCNDMIRAMAALHGGVDHEP
jgi:hypothetical protein